MAKKITAVTETAALSTDAHALVTQTEDGKVVLRRAPAELVGAGSLSAKFLEDLPTATFENDFTSEVGFVAQTRCTAALEDETAAITTANNAGNLYAYAYYDLSSTLTDETTTAVIEYDAVIPEGSRVKFSLIDISARTDSSGNIAPGSSSKDSYDTAGVAFTFGEYNTGYALLQDTTPACTFGSTMHFKFVIDNEARTVVYTITQGEITLFTGTTEFLGDDAKVVSGIEMYTYAGDITAYFDSLTITANYGATDTTLYVVGTADSGYTLYLYKDGEPIAITSKSS